MHTYFDDGPGPMSRRIGRLLGGLLSDRDRELVLEHLACRFGLSDPTSVASRRDQLARTFVANVLYPLAKLEVDSCAPIDERRRWFEARKRAFERCADEAKTARDYDHDRHVEDLNQEWHAERLRAAARQCRWERVERESEAERERSEKRAADRQRETDDNVAREVAAMVRRHARAHQEEMRQLEDAQNESLAQTVAFTAVLLLSMRSGNLQLARDYLHALPVAVLMRQSHLRLSLAAAEAMMRGRRYPGPPPLQRRSRELAEEVAVSGRPTFRDEPLVYGTKRARGPERAAVSR